MSMIYIFSALNEMRQQALKLSYRSELVDDAEAVDLLEGIARDITKVEMILWPEGTE